MTDPTVSVHEADRSHRRYPGWQIANDSLQSTQCGDREITPELTRSALDHIKEKKEAALRRISAPSDYVMRWTSKEFYEQFLTNQGALSR